MQNVNYGSLFLSPLDGGTVALIAVLVAIVFAALGVLFGWFLTKKSFNKKQGDIKKVTDKMLDDAREECKQIKKEAILEAKEQELKLRNDFERETCGTCPHGKQTEPKGRVSRQKRRKSR